MCFEKAPTERKTGTAGWYNTAAFHEKAKAKGLYAETINGDAFSDEIKNEAIDKIKAEMGKVDLVIYSLASPRRTDPETGSHKVTLKPVGRTLQKHDTDKDKVHEVSQSQPTKDP